MSGNNMPLNGEMNDGTYRIQLTGDKVSWEGRPFHYIERDELETIWNRMAACRIGLRERRHQLRQTVENLEAPIYPLPVYPVYPGAGTVDYVPHVGGGPDAATAGPGWCLLGGGACGRGASLPAKLPQLNFVINLIYSEIVNVTLFF